MNSKCSPLICNMYAIFMCICICGFRHLNPWCVFIWMLLNYGNSLLNIYVVKFFSTINNTGKNILVACFMLGFTQVKFLEVKFPDQKMGFSFFHTALEEDGVHFHCQQQSWRVAISPYFQHRWVFKANKNLVTGRVQILPPCSVLEVMRTTFVLRKGQLPDFFLKSRVQCHL